MRWCSHHGGHHKVHGGPDEGESTQHALDLVKPQGCCNSLAMQNKRKKRKATTQCELGSLEDLRDSGKGGQDPNGRGSTIVATDVLWSDPVGAEVAEGLHPNVTRGVGVVFGPDVTQVS